LQLLHLVRRQDRFQLVAHPRQGFLHFLPTLLGRQILQPLQHRPHRLGGLGLHLFDLLLLIGRQVHARQRPIQPAIRCGSVVGTFLFAARADIGSPSATASSTIAAQRGPFQFFLRVIASFG